MIDQQKVTVIQQDLNNQEVFISTLIAFINQVGYSKREPNVTDLEIGFKLGEVFRMLHELHSDSTRLRNEITEILLQITTEPKNDQPNKIFLD